MTFVALHVPLISGVKVYVYYDSSKNTFSVKKVRPSKVESYLEMNT